MPFEGICLTKLWSFLSLGCMAEERLGLPKGHFWFCKESGAWNRGLVWGNQEARRECWTQGSVSARPIMGVRFRASKLLK